ncbi:MAG: YfdX family protein [Magnetococcales bacterium]|nr:YfdX family protein [Magnetococcales bacterium]MBF0629903.1 YfdX family protein [Magnetococcales bacterium]
MRKSRFKSLDATLIVIAMMASSMANATESSLPVEPQKQSAATDSVKTEVEGASSDMVLEKRKKILEEASTALSETETALKALGEKKPDVAISALEKATGKLELILARDPGLALAPVDTSVVTYDLLANIDTVKAMIHDAENYLEDGEIQKARPIVRNLASEIVYQSRNIPLATYPAAIKAVVSLIDKGEIDNARIALQSALNTLVVTTDKVIPLPKLRTEHLLKKAEELANKKDRSPEEDKTLEEEVAAVRDQLKLAELLGYGDKESYKPLYTQLGEIEEKISGGKSGRGWFANIREKVSEML